MSLPIPQASSRVVITGASSGIGEQLAKQFAMRGYSLVLVARRVEKLEVLAEKLKAEYQISVDLYPCDLGDRTARAKFRDYLENIEIAILCNNAGFATFGCLQDLDADREREEVEVNSVTIHDLTLAVLPQMIKRKAGAILIVGSTSGHQPTPANATYAATKAFANSFAESLHSELKGTGVSCTLLAPGPTKTGFNEVAGITKIDGVGGGLVWVTAERVAKEAIQGMDRNCRIVIPGFVAQAQTFGGRYTPRIILLPILKQVFSRLSP
ncbi:SDR family NAD(P)-dependent oxidoreductase [Acinetobacter seifertii]|uniref:SDR family oxidoreductase n=1 Tax=Acinetobacter seifertii TaxID=1530123 RepID=A0A7H2PVZ4_9GAMM|nr:SDR family oxidoreductase [Acinetobacter seifertii]QNX07027.1 SDR family oxidoreductase [Acinetobacter seifertii]QNX17426.1 SDR family oxidoreductase [Acinetobacter seifertii]